MICEKCKEEIADNLKFCNKCGAKIVAKPSLEIQNSQDGANSQTANTTAGDVGKTGADSVPQSTSKKTNSMIKKCIHCGADLDVSAAFCDKCGTKQSQSEKSVPKEKVKVSTKSRITAGLLGIFLGGFGIHNFYLGFKGKAVLQILLSVFCCGVGSIWGLIEGIMILAKKINVDSTGASLK